MNRLIFGALVILLLVMGSQKTYASHSYTYDNFRHHNLTDSSVFRKSDSMSTSAIQSFLNGQGGELASKTFGGKTAAQIIKEAANDYGINPRVIIATLQKEQSLITDPDPHSSQYNSAMGYDCPTSGSCNPSYAGFANQVDNGTWQLRLNFQRASGISGSTADFPYSQSYVCASASTFYNNGLFPGNSVGFRRSATGAPYRTTNLANAATASLYCYTPHAYSPYYSGSYNFVVSWEHWFGSLYSNVRLIQPNGTTDVYLIEGSTKRKFKNTSALEAWGFDGLFAEPVSTTYANSFTTVTPEIDRYVKDSVSKIKYFIDNRSYYRLTSASLIDTWQFEDKEFAPVKLGVITSLVSGGNLTNIVRSPFSSSIFLIDDGMLRGFNSPNTLLAWTGPSPNGVTLSAAYYCQSGDEAGCPVRFTIGSSLTHTRIKTASSSQQYFVNSTKKYSLSATVGTLYPFGTQTVSQPTLDLLPSGGSMQALIKAIDSKTISLMDTEYRSIAGTGHLKNWAPGGNLSTVLVNNNFLNQLTSGSLINSNFCTNSGVAYVIDGGTKRTFTNDETKNLWLGSNVPIACGNAITNFYSNGTPATRVIRGSSKTIYAMENGRKRPISSLGTYQNTYQQYGLTHVSDYLLSNIPTGTTIR